MAITLLGLGIVFSQFYLFQSGEPQPAHYIIALSMTAVLFSKKGTPLFEGDKLIVKLLLALIAYQGIVNMVYFSLHYSWDFVWQSTYIFYGFAIFFTIYKLSQNNKDQSLKIISLFCLLALVISFLLSAFGAGEYRFYPRYNAFFNDPNQMAFWVLCISSILIYYFKTRGKFVLCAIIASVSTYLIILTASRSGALGLSTLILGFLTEYTKKNRGKLKIQNALARFLGILIIVYSGYSILNIDASSTESIISRFHAIDVSEQTRTRGHTRIIDFPEYIFLGAGHGMNSRFDAGNIEIHSTWIGLLFYYGIFGFFLFSAAIVSISAKLNFCDKLIFIAPLLYSHSTFGFRTPIFWIFLGFFYATTLKRSTERTPAFRI